jgi:hypothetical protein
LVEVGMNRLLPPMPHVVKNSAAARNAKSSRQDAGQRLDIKLPGLPWLLVSDAHVDEQDPAAAFGKQRLTRSQHRRAYRDVRPGDGMKSGSTAGCRHAIARR